ncbi:hypothetical protein [Synechocystis salina]|uniref:Uncharacterized protein n=1 Tax=Synechocystis salina LEGE 00031 TaxID=1828736 RepID=A0ABR9VR96_9SYNC|nr:hypothetical protein [Synechocystis salina]MBE9242878.1 hypothetical protein [Synechocystis salina LEGE 00041]MBE9253842.1 hypothetical protein [Synechocystis salina LEGE 00031]
MGRGRPGGNPDLKKHAFKTEREVPCTAQISLRITPEQKEKLYAVSNWREILRHKILEIIATND